MKLNKNEYFGQITVAFLGSKGLQYSTAEEGHCDLAEIFIYILFHLSDTHLRAGRCSCLSWVSAAVSPLPFWFCFLPFQVFFIIHKETKL